MSINYYHITKKKNNTFIPLNPEVNTRYLPTNFTLDWPEKNWPLKSVLLFGDSDVKLPSFTWPGGVIPIFKKKFPTSSDMNTMQPKLNIRTIITNNYSLNLKLF